MEQNPSEPQITPNSPFLDARVYTRNPRPRTKFISDCTETRRAWIALTSAIRWKHITRRKLYGEGYAWPPNKFTEFGPANYLRLDHLNPGASPDDLKDAVYHIHDENEAGIAVRGTHLLRVVELMILLDKELESELIELESVLRVRIAPWRLLQELTGDLKENPQTWLDLSELRNQLVNLSSAAKLQDLIPDSSTVTQHKALPGLNETIWFTEHVRFTSDAMKTVTDVIDKTSAILKRAAPAIACGAQNVAEFTKCVWIVSSAFQLVALGV